MMIAIAYLTVLIIGTWRFVRRDRVASVWWVAFFSTAVYGLPALTGVDVFGVEVAPLATGWMVAVMASLLILATVAARRSAPVMEDARTSTRSSMAARVAVAFAIAVSAGMLFLYGTEIFFVHKLLSGVHGAAYIAWRLSASVAFVVAVIARRTIPGTIALVILISTFFAGDRTAIGLTAIAALWVVMSRTRLGGRSFAFASAVAAAVGLTLFFGKLFLAVWWSQGGMTIGSVVSDAAADVRAAGTATEPFGVIAVFSRIVDTELTAPLRLFVGSLAQILPIPSYFGFQSAAFNDYFQPLLFPALRERSLAYSFWGEGFAYFGLAGLLLYLGIYVGGLWAFGRLARSSRGPLLRAFAYLAGAYWAFYIHRNSLASILAYERHIAMYVAVIGVICVLGGMRQRDWSDHRLHPLDQLAGTGWGADPSGQTAGPVDRRGV